MAERCETCGNPSMAMTHKCTDYLKYLLAKYGGHTKECAWHLMGFYDGASEQRSHGRCDCSWDEVKND